MTMLRGRVFGVAKEKKKRSCVNSTRRCAQASSTSFSFAKLKVFLSSVFSYPQVGVGTYLTHKDTLELRLVFIVQRIPTLTISLPKQYLQCLLENQELDVNRHVN